MSEPSTFQIPATIVSGAGSSRNVGEQARRLGAERALLVTDPFMVSSGVAGVVEDCLVRAGVRTTVFHGVQPDPTDENVADGFAAMRAADAEVVVAVGGGSAIDAAKMISVSCLLTLTMRRPFLSLPLSPKRPPQATTNRETTRNRQAAKRTSRNRIA